MQAKRVFPLVSLLLVLAPAIAAAGTEAQPIPAPGSPLPPAGITVDEWGTYTAGNGVEGKPTDKGIRRISVTDIHHVSTTRTVLAVLGVHFGFGYRITGVPAGTVVPVRYVIFFPKPGVMGSVTDKRIVEDHYTDLTYAAEHEYWLWSFDMRSEIVPGVWRVQVWSGGKMLTEQKFNVELPPSS